MFAIASICSIRDHNQTVPIKLFLDGKAPDVDHLAKQLGFSVVRLSCDRYGEHVRSRLLKIHALANTSFQRILYLDADTLVLDDVAKIQAQLFVPLDADVFLLLRRPRLISIWDYGRLHFTDPTIDKEEIVRLVSTTFGLPLTSVDLGRLNCWNGGVIFGCRQTLEAMSARWLAAYQRMISASTSGAFVPNDQLSLWLTVWKAGNAIRVGELPLCWNFMPGHALGLKPNTCEIENDALASACILHLGPNKRDQWALDRIAMTLARHDAEKTFAGELCY